MVEAPITLSCPAHSRRRSSLPMPFWNEHTMRTRSSERCGLGEGGFGVLGLGEQDHQIELAVRLVGVGDAAEVLAHHEIAVDAADAQAVGLDGVHVPGPADQRHVLAGARQHAADDRAQTAGAADDESHGVSPRVECLSLCRPLGQPVWRLSAPSRPHRTAAVRDGALNARARSGSAESTRLLGQLDAPGRRSASDPATPAAVPRRSAAGRPGAAARPAPAGLA